MVKPPGLRLPGVQGDVRRADARCSNLRNDDPEKYDIEGASRAADRRSQFGRDEPDIVYAVCRCACFLPSNRSRPGSWRWAPKLIATTRPAICIWCAF